MSLGMRVRVCELTGSLCGVLGGETEVDPKSLRTEATEGGAPESKHDGCWRQRGSHHLIKPMKYVAKRGKLSLSITHHFVHDPIPCLLALSGGERGKAALVLLSIVWDLWG